AQTPLTAELPRHELARGSEVLGVLPRALAAGASGLGALVVVAGALWSAVRERGARRGHLVAANLLIALGTVVTGASGLLNSVLDEMDGFAVTLLVGITLIFAGFLVATAGSGRRLPGHDQELDQPGAEDDGQQDGQSDRRPPPHGASSVTGSPVWSRSSSAADRRSSATDTKP
ncbi:MAG: hypothetical protein ACRDY5_06990, partial [Acidimicrobiales bacterium]